MAAGFSVRRAWSPHVAEGPLRDQLANRLASRIAEENQESEVQGYPAVLAENFLDLCDAIFEAASPTTSAAVDALAESADTSDLYELSDA